MKTFLYLILISSFLFFSCNKVNSNRNSEMKEYKCSFIGNNIDINNFLDIENIKGNDEIILQVFANQYMFLKKGKPLKMYVFYKETNVFETFKLKEVSTQLKTDRKYRLQISDSTSNSFKLKLESRDKTFTQMRNNSIIIECSAIGKGED